MSWCYSVLYLSRLLLVLAAESPEPPTSPRPAHAHSVRVVSLGPSPGIRVLTQPARCMKTAQLLTLLETLIDTLPFSQDMMCTESHLPSFAPPLRFCALVSPLFRVRLAGAAAVCGGIQCRLGSIRFNSSLFSLSFGSSKRRDGVLGVHGLRTSRSGDVVRIEVRKLTAQIVGTRNSLLRAKCLVFSLHTRRCFIFL